MGLCGLLIVLIGVRATMHLWVHPPVDTEKDRRLVAAWEVFKRSQPVAKNDSVSAPKKDFQDAFDENTTPLPDSININIADSAILVRLKGIGPATAHKIIARRTNKGLFTSIDQLSEVGSFPSATLELLKKHLIVK